MRLCGNLAIFLLLVWLKPGNGKKDGAGRGGKDGVVFRGKFSGRGGERCTWTASGETRYTLSIRCRPVKKETHQRGYTCEYTAEPALCPLFGSRPKAFWRQVSAGLKTLKAHLCRDAQHTIQTRACKSAPTASHFRLISPKIITMTTTRRLPEDTPTTECTDHRQLAQEKCGNEWASVCNFLFSVMQSTDC